MGRTREDRGRALESGEGGKGRGGSGEGPDGGNGHGGLASLQKPRWTTVVPELWNVAQQE